MPDCLICLENTQDTWTPLTPCSCHPILHRACWKAWVLQSGSVCIICRQFPTQEDELYPVEEPPIIWVDTLQPITNMLFFRACILVLFYFSIFGFKRSIHDEL